MFVAIFIQNNNKKTKQKSKTKQTILASALQTFCHLQKFKIFLVCVCLTIQILLTSVYDNDNYFKPVQFLSKFQVKKQSKKQSKIILPCALQTIGFISMVKKRSKSEIQKQTKQKQKQKQKKHCALLRKQWINSTFLEQIILPFADNFPV